MKVGIVALHLSSLHLGSFPRIGRTSRMSTSAARQPLLQRDDHQALKNVGCVRDSPSFHQRPLGSMFLESGAQCESLSEFRLEAAGHGIRTH
jgi:hypothetical protein